MKPGPDRVDPQAGGAVLVGGVAHERLEPGLGDRVRAEPEVGDVAGDRRHADERPAPRLHEVRHRALQRDQRAEHVELQHPGELADVLQVRGRHTAAAARVGDHRVEPAGRLARDVDRRLHAVLVGDVGGDVLHAPAVAHRFTDDLGGVDETRLGATADGDRGTVGGEAAPRTPSRSRCRRRSRARRSPRARHSVCVTSSTSAFGVHVRRLDGSRDSRARPARCAAPRAPSPRAPCFTSISVEKPGSQSSWCERMTLGARTSDA